MTSLFSHFKPGYLNPRQSSYLAHLSSQCLFYSTDDQAKKDASTKSTPKVSFKKDIMQKTPIGKLDEFVGKHPYEEKEPLPKFKDGVNPKTGEIGGPAGPEPTRYGDWERKGRVSDF